MASFCVFMQAAADQTFVVDAGPLIVRNIDIDDFRRYWTGHTVIVDTERNRWANLSTAAILGLCVPLSAYTIARFVYSRQHRTVISHNTL